MRVTAKYEGDSKRYHRYRITDNRITGTIYFPKGSEIPDQVDIVTGDPKEAADDAGN